MGEPVRVSDLPPRVARELRRGQAVDITSRGRNVPSIVPLPAGRPGHSIAEELGAWRRRHPELPDDPFGQGWDPRLSSVSREVEW